jgi:hypothetical protein
LKPLEQAANAIPKMALMKGLRTAETKPNSFGGGFPRRLSGASE